MVECDKNKKDLNFKVSFLNITQPACHLIIYIHIYICVCVYILNIYLGGGEYSEYSEVRCLTLSGQG